jgi:GxxExxY protein
MLLFEELSGLVIGKSYEVMNELGPGFLESIYHKSLFLALKQEGIRIDYEYPLAVKFRGYNVGNFKVDLLVEEKIIVEIKALENIIGAHKAQVINYLSTSGLPVGIIVNFGKQKIQTSRLENSKIINSII